MAMICREQLREVFRLCDPTGKGFISSDDLLRAAGNGGGPVSDILALLRLGDRDTLDFGQFCQRVFEVVSARRAQSTQPDEEQESESGMGSGSGSGYGDDDEDISNSSDEYHHYNATIAPRHRSRALADEVAEEACKKQRFVEARSNLGLHFEDLQVEMRQELERAMEENERRVEEEVQRRCAATRAAVEEMIAAERRRLEAAVRAEEEAFAAKVRRLEWEREAVDCQAQTIRELLSQMEAKADEREVELERLGVAMCGVEAGHAEAAQRQRDADDEIAALRLAKSALEERVLAMEGQLEAESARIDRVVSAAAEEREGHAEEKAALDAEVRELRDKLDRLSDGLDRGSVGYASFSSYSPSPLTARKAVRKFGSLSNVSVAVEAMPDYEPEETFESYAHLIVQNRDLHSENNDLKLRNDRLQSKVKAFAKKAKTSGGSQLRKLIKKPSFGKLKGSGGNSLHDEMLSAVTEAEAIDHSALEESVLHKAEAMVCNKLERFVGEMSDIRERVDCLLAGRRAGHLGDLIADVGGNGKSCASIVIQDVSSAVSSLGDRVSVLEERIHG